MNKRFRNRLQDIEVFVEPGEDWRDAIKKENRRIHYEIAPDWIEVSQDNTHYVRYTALNTAAQNGEIRIEGHNKTGEKTRLLIRDFEAILSRPPKRAKKVFVSYSHSNAHWLSRLRTHLSGLRRSNDVETWTDREIQPGEFWDQKIKDALREADVFILLLSADFVASEYVWKEELPLIFDCVKNDPSKRIIPVLAEPLDFGSLPGIQEIETEDGRKELKIQDFGFTPKDHEGRHLRPISLWSNPDEALATVAQQIREAIVGKQPK